jgi:hypothetical protein
MTRADRVEASQLRVRRFRTAWHCDVPDRDVAWVVHVFKCHDQALWCLRHLRTHYPTSRVTVINDGDSVCY